MVHVAIKHIAQSGTCNIWRCHPTVTLQALKQRFDADTSMWERKNAISVVLHSPIKGELAGIGEGCIQGRGSCLEALGPVNRHRLERGCEGGPAVWRNDPTQGQHLKDLGAG